METWLLILFINGALTKESYSASLEFNTQIECIRNGQRISKELTIVKNEDNKWLRKVGKKAIYTCNKVIRNEK